MKLFALLVQSFLNGYLVFGWSTIQLGIFFRHITPIWDGFLGGLCVDKCWIQLKGYDHTRKNSTTILGLSHFLSPSAWTVTRLNTGNGGNLGSNTFGPEPAGRARARIRSRSQGIHWRSPAARVHCIIRVCAQKLASCQLAYAQIRFCLCQDLIQPI